MWADICIPERWSAGYSSIRGPEMLKLSRSHWHSLEMQAAPRFGPGMGSEAAAASYWVGPAYARVAGIPFHGMYDTVFTVFYYAYMICISRVVPVKKDNAAGFSEPGRLLNLKRTLKKMKRRYGAPPLLRVISLSKEIPYRLCRRCRKALHLLPHLFHVLLQSILLSLYLLSLLPYPVSLTVRKAHTICWKYPHILA